MTLAAMSTEMTFPTIVRSQVDLATITKVTRLFNNTIGDVLAELM